MRSTCLRTRALPVYSASAGIVVLAEGNWKPDQPFSTSSIRGGNSVIVFDPAENRFYRYCHLEKVLVIARTPVEAGQQIGAVGHTGFNASRPGHGGHLHFEINQYEDGTVHALTDKQLRAWLTNVSRLSPTQRYNADPEPAQSGLTRRGPANLPGTARNR